MAPNDNSGARPGPVVLRIKLRYDGVDAMVQKFASNVGKSGLFLPTKSIQPVGTDVKFELRLANDAPVLVGLGRVKHVKHPDPANPKAAFGMAIELLRVSREGREVIIRMIERRRALGLPDVAIPVPEDVETARRSEIESQPRADTTGIVGDAMAQMASGPVSEQVLASPPSSAPSPVGKQESSRVPAPVLPAEPSRSRRPRVQELIDKAAELSGPIIAAIPVPELDMHVDLDRVLSRARALAGGELEVELAALREAAAAPVEITVDAASAELARQLGGQPISKRERSARWARPPAIEAKSEPLAVPVAARQEARDDSTPDVASLDDERDREAVEPATANDAATREEAAVRAASTDEPLRDEPRADGSNARDPASEFAARTRAETEAAPSATIAAVVDAAVEASPSHDAYDAHASQAAPLSQHALRATEVTDDPAVAQHADAEAAAADDDAFAANVTTTTAIDPDIDAATELPRRSYGTDREIVTQPAVDAATELRRRSYGTAREIATEPAVSGMLIDDDADVASFERALDADRIRTTDGPAPPAGRDDRELGPERAGHDLLAPNDDEVELLASGEYQLDEFPAESTEIGQRPAGVSNIEYPSIPDQLAAQLDQQLAEAEAEAEREFAEGIGGTGTAHEPPGYTAQGHEAQGYDAQSYEAQGYDASAHAAAAGYEASPEQDVEEISDLDVLSEAVADADLLNAQREPDASVGRAAAPEQDDFAARLDLGDDDEVPPIDDAFDPNAAREFDAQPGYIAPEDEYAEDAVELRRRKRASSSGDFPDPPSSSYTFAENFPQAGLHLSPSDHVEEFDEPHNYSAAAASPRAKRPSEVEEALAAVRHEPPRPHQPSQDLEDALAAMSEPNAPARSDDLEDALAALDVDLDDISLEQRRARRATPTSQRPLPGLPMERPRIDPPTERPRTPTLRGAMTAPLPATPAQGAEVAPRTPTPAQGAAAVPRTPTPAQGAAAVPRTPTPAQGAAAVPRAPTPASGSAAVPPKVALHTVRRERQPPTMPPPIPAAARMKPPTQQQAVVQPAKRATTDDGVLIEFEDDE